MNEHKSGEKYTGEISFSVIIPCKNAEQTLPTCLHSILNQAEAPLEIIVVNDRSSDRTESIAKKFPVIILNTISETGAAAARKVGADAAKGDILAFIDADCEAPPDWLAQIRGQFDADPELGAVGGRYTHAPRGSIIGKLFALEEEYIYYRFAKHPESANPPWGNFAMRKNLWTSLRTSRELFYFAGMASGEDTVFCEELRKSSKLRFIYSLAVCHHTNEAGRYFHRHISRGRSRSIIRLYQLASPQDNKNVIDAYGGYRMVWASIFLSLALLAFPVSLFFQPFALAVPFLFFFLYIICSYQYCKFMYQYNKKKISANRISLLENLIIRIFLALRPICWGIGVIWALTDYLRRQAEKWSNLFLSILHFWRPGRVSKLFYFITASCNGKCAFCFNLENVINGQERKIYELTLEEVTAISRKLGRLPYLTLSGGEPFLREDIVDVVAAFYKHSKTQWVTIPSNATLTPSCLEKTAQILNRCPNLYLTVQASLDALGKDHDRSRNITDGFQKLSKTLDGWRYLSQFYPNLRIQLAVCYDDSNKDRIMEVIQYCQQNYGFHQLTLYLLREPHTKITQTNSHLLPSYFEVLKEIHRLGLDRNKRRSLTSKKWPAFWHKIVKAIQLSVYRDLYYIKKEQTCLRPCRATSKFITLFDDGQVSPCEVLDQCSLGNIRDFNYDYYQLKREQKVDEYRSREIVKGKCTCDWICALPVNMLYDFKGGCSVMMNLLFSQHSDFPNEKIDNL